MDFERLKPGSRIGDYQIISTLGSGGMGVVFLVRHVSTGATHALKLILARRFTDRPDQLLQRFQREVEVLARIEPHPGVVRVHSYGILDKSPWCVMEHVTGESLAQVLDRGPTPTKLAATLVAKLCVALHHIHGHGVVHRDIKPPNVLIDDQGEPRLVDFGIAFDLYAESLTRTGETVGTPAFMAPEQIHRSSSSGEQMVVGPAADIYGAGAVLYSCLTGRPPFHAHSMLELVAHVTTTPPTSPREIRPEIPADLEAICLTALRKDPDARYASAMDMAMDLERWLRNEPVQARLAGPIRRLWQRLAPRTRKARAAAGVLATALMVLMLALLNLNRDTQASLDRSLSKLLAAWEKQQPLTNQHRKNLEGIFKALQEQAAASEAAAEDDDYKRRLASASLLKLVDRAARDPGETNIGAELADLVRPDGKIKRALVRQSTKLLAQLDRPGLLDTLLHRHDPVIPAPPDVATAVARFLVTDSQVLAVPTGKRAFNALYEAKELTSSERGRLLLRRGNGHIEKGDYAAALADFVTALQEHQESGNPQSWPKELKELAQRKIIEESVSNVQAAWDICDLLALSKGDRGSFPKSEIEKVQKLAAANMIAAQQVSDVDKAAPLRRALLYGSFLERWGMSPRPLDEIPALIKHLKAEWLVIEGNDQARKERRLRNPATLLLLGRLLVALPSDELQEEARHSHQKAARRWLEAARACGIDEPWFHLQAARLLLASEHAAEAIEAARQALKQDESRPAEQRWPAIPETLSLALEARSQQTKDSNQLLEALRHTREAMSVQREVLGEPPYPPPKTQIVHWLGAGSWPQARRQELARLTQQLTERVLDDKEVACCEEGSWAGVPNLVTAALQLEPSNDLYDRLLSLQARHLHDKHGQTEEAIQALTAPRDHPFPLTGSDDERAARREKQKLLTRLLRAAGREAEAQGAERKLESERR